MSSGKPRKRHLSSPNSPRPRRPSGKGPGGVEDVSPSGTPVRLRDELTRQQKEAVILRTLEDPVDVDTLRQLAISRGGLVTNKLRQLAWPKLLGVDVSNIAPKPDEETLHAHRDYSQVVLDVNRSLKRFPPGMAEEHRMSLQDQLVDVIMRVLVANDDLHYYQGFHDICVTFLLVVGEDLTFALMDKLSKEHLRDFMDKDMERTKHILNYLYPIVGRSNPALRAFLEKSEVGTIFCLSWLITWYGHVLGELKNIVRLYDYFISCHPLMPVYLGATVVLYRAEAIMATECEMCYVHSLLSKLPSDLPFEQLALQAGDLYIRFPPAELADEAQAISDASAAECANLVQERRSVAAIRTRRSGRSGRFGGFLLQVGLWTMTAALSSAAFYLLRTHTDMISWPWR